MFCHFQPLPEISDSFVALLGGAPDSPARTLSILSNLFVTLNSHIGPTGELIHNKLHARTRGRLNSVRK